MSIHTHLEQYLASIQNVPHELRQQMQSIRTLDAKQQALHAQLQREQAEFVVEAREKTDAGEEIDEGFFFAFFFLARRSLGVVVEHLQTLKEQYRTILTLCDKKVQLANEAYQMLDESIRKLDADLRKFEVELEQKELNLTAAERRKRKASSGIGPAEQRRLFAG